VLTELTIRVLAQPFFAGLTIGLVRELCECASAETFPAGATIFTEGGPAEAFWLLEEGTVALGLHVPGRGDQVIETIGPGTVLGWSWPAQRLSSATTNNCPRFVTGYWQVWCSSSVWPSSPGRGGSALLGHCRPNAGHVSVNRSVQSSPRICMIPCSTRWR